MAAVESYSPCPCGSGQKFKWCCQKVESYADKAQRLFESGQVDAAIKALDEGLRKEPGNPWLLTRKAVMQIRNGQAEGAKGTLRQVLARNPKHFGALILLTRCVLETEGPINGAGMFQETLVAVDDEQRPSLASLARVVAYLLGEFPPLPRCAEAPRNWSGRWATPTVRRRRQPGASRPTRTSPPGSRTSSRSPRPRSTGPARVETGSSKRLATLPRGCGRRPRRCLTSFPAANRGARPTTTSGSAGSGLATRREPWSRSGGGLRSSERRPKRLTSKTLCQLIAPVHPEDRVKEVPVDLAAPEPRRPARDAPGRQGRGRRRRGTGRPRKTLSRP